MSEKSKLEYLKILVNIKDNVYKDNSNLLKKDLLTLKKLLLLESNKNDRKLLQVYNGLQKIKVRG